MNITNVNAAGSSGTGSTSSKNQDLQTIGTKGQIVEGIISKISDKISINFSGKEVTVSKSAVQNAKEGEIRKFEIMDVSDKSIVLKEVGNSINNTGNTGIICTSVESLYSAKERLGQKEEEKESDEESKSLEKITDRLTNKDYETLIKEGKLLEAYELTRLERALERIKTQRENNKVSLEKQIEKQEEYRTQMKEVITSNLVKSGVPKEIIDKLFEADIPVTVEKVTEIGNTLSLAETVTPISDKAKCYIIKNELEPTIDNLYHGLYSGSVIKSKVEDAAWEDISPQAKAVVQKAGLEATKDNMDKAKWLFQNQLPITEDTLNRLEQLEQLNTKMDNDILVDKVIDAVAKGKLPKEASLCDNSLDIAKQAVYDFSNIVDEAIAKIIEEDKELTLDNLKSINLDNNNKEQQYIIPLLEDGIIDIKAITAKRQLEEIRLKMTVEAGQRLVGKGIDLNTSELTRIVEGLRELEDHYYKNLLTEGNLDKTDENVNLLRETTERVHELKFIPSYILGITLEEKSAQTIRSLTDSGANLKTQLEKAGASYEVLMTAPRRDMGDSIEKAFQNVDTILSDLNLEATEANRRAVRILGYNRMQITEESIMNIKEYDSKVNYLMNNLHPAVTVDLIRNGINPLSIPIDALNQQITDLKESLGVTDEEKYSKYLWKLEKSNAITEEERKAYIGIYRLLNNVDKTKGAAVGAVVNAGQELNLNNLLTAVRTRKGNGINQAVNDAFGGLESLTFKNESITDQIESVYAKSDTIAYYSNMVSQLAATVSPDKISNLEDNQLEHIMSQSLERFYENMNAMDDSAEDAAYYQEKVELIRTLAQNSEESIEFLNSNKLPVTLQNIEAVKNMLENDYSLFKDIKSRVKRYSEQEQNELNQVLDELTEGLSDAESMQHAYDKAEQTMQNILNQEYGRTTISTKELADLKRLSNGIELAKNLSNNQCYEIPIVTGDSVTQINLTIVNGAKDSGKVQISLESEQLGKMQAEFQLKGDSLKAMILCDNAEGLAQVTKGNHLIEKLTNLGLEVRNISTGISKVIKNVFLNDSMEQNKPVDTKMLYRVAKTFVIHIKQTEQQH